MTESGARSGRLLSIVLLLQRRGAATAAQLAAQLGVSVRTVYRDVQVLERIGVPIYSETGRAGGYRLVGGYRTSLTGLTAQESLALFLIGLPAPAASLGLGEPARAAEAKVLAALSPGHREQADRLRGRFHLDVPPWYQDAETPAALPLLANALLGDRRVQVLYRRWDEPREVRRLLDPYGLVLKNGTWYLVAAGGRGRASARTYRVGNIRKLQVSDETSTRPPDFDLAAFWAKHLLDFERRRIAGTARLRISPTLATRLPDVGDAALRAAAQAGVVDDAGWTVLELPIETPQWAAAQLIRYGKDIEVLEPAELRRSLHSLAQSVVDRYRADAPARSA
jgi:predicted DNA-binding transcriptional regulator YafY